MRLACSKTPMCFEDAASETVKGSASSVTRIGRSRRALSISRRTGWLKAANVASKAGSYSTIGLNNNRNSVDPSPGSGGYRGADDQDDSVLSVSARTGSVDTARCVDPGRRPGVAGRALHGNKPQPGAQPGPGAHRREV